MLSSDNMQHTTDTKKVAAKYRDPHTGKEWSGRGLTPNWVKMHESLYGNRDALLIQNL